MHDLVIALAFIGLTIVPAVVMAKTQVSRPTQHEAEVPSAEELKTY
ncbi:hypothetical protein [Acidicapsa ligni]|nr:hypothetical protein [Acidicapsa ligni]